MGRRVIPQAAIVLLKEMIWKGLSYRVIAGRFLVSEGYISAIATGRRYSHTEWPDGSTGRLSEARAAFLAATRLSASAETQTALSAPPSPNKPTSSPVLIQEAEETHSRLRDESLLDILGGDPHKPLVSPDKED